MGSSWGNMSGCSDAKYSEGSSGRHVRYYDQPAYASGKGIHPDALDSNRDDSFASLPEIDNMLVVDSKTVWERLGLDIAKFLRHSIPRASEKSVPRSKC